MAAGDHGNTMEMDTLMYRERFSRRMLLDEIDEALACTEALCKTQNFDLKLANATTHVADCRQGMYQCSTCVALDAVVHDHWNLHRHPRAQRMVRDTRSRDPSERPLNEAATGVMLIFSFIFSMGASLFNLNNSKYFWLFIWLSVATKAIFSKYSKSKYTGTAIFTSQKVDALL